MPDHTPTAPRARPWRTVFLVFAAITIAAQLAGLVWVAQGQVERGRALQGGVSVTRLISGDPCLNYRIAAAPHPADRCGRQTPRALAETR